MKKASHLQWTTTQKGFVFVILAGVMWGLSGVFGQFLFQERAIPPLWLAQQRLIVSGLILLTIAYIRQGHKVVFALWKSPKDVMRVIIYSIFGSMAVQVTFLIAIQYSNAATATILQFLSPVIIAIYIALKLKKPPTKVMIFAVALAVIGTFFLVTHGNINTLNISPKALVWGIGSAFAAAFYVMYSSTLILRWGTWVIIGWSMLIGGLSLMPVSSFFSLPGDWDWATIVAVLYMVIPGSVITFSLYLIGAQYIGGQKASILTSSEPLSAAILSIFIMNVQFNFMDWLGTFCIIATVILLALNRA